jgi:hypothetical protein
VRRVTRPALRTTEFFFAAAGLGGRRSVLDAALLAHTYRDVFLLTGPSALLAPLVAQVARLRGRRLPAPH